MPHASFNGNANRGLTLGSVLQTGALQRQQETESYALPIADPEPLRQRFQRRRCGLRNNTLQKPDGCCGIEPRPSACAMSREAHLLQTPGLSDLSFEVCPNLNQDQSYARTLVPVGPDLSLPFTGHIPMANFSLPALVFAEPVVRVKIQRARQRSCGKLLATRYEKRTAAAAAQSREGSILGRTVAIPENGACVETH